jgi:hypothetical protein
VKSNYIEAVCLAFGADARVGEFVGARKALELLLGALPNWTLGDAS